MVVTGRANIDYLYPFSPQIRKLLDSHLYYEVTLDKDGKLPSLNQISEPDNLVTSWLQ